MRNESTISEQEINAWEADQRLCDIADSILKGLTKKCISVQETLNVLDKAKKAIEKSMLSANWGEPLVCNSPKNEAAVWNPENTEIEFNRRKCQDAS